MVLAKAMGVTAAPAVGGASVMVKERTGTGQDCHSVAGFATSTTPTGESLFLCLHPGAMMERHHKRMNMPVLESKLNARSADFQANAAAMRAMVDDLRVQLAKVAEGGGTVARNRHTGRGKLLPRDRVQMLLDPGTPFL